MAHSFISRTPVPKPRPEFTERTEADNPWDRQDAGEHSKPTFADLDGDGDFDTVVGARLGGELYYFENTGTAIAPAFTERLRVDNPFFGIDVSRGAAPALADIDGDGDLDTLVGTSGLRLIYLENTGTALAPRFVRTTGASDRFGSISFSGTGTITPTLVDIDGDRSIEVLAGDDLGQFIYMRTSFRAIASVDEENASESALRLALYPNPATARGGFTFEAEAREAGVLAVEVYDVLGRLVESLGEAAVTPGEVVRVQVGGLAAGNYLVRARQGARATTQRVSIVR